MHNPTKPAINVAEIGKKNENKMNHQHGGNGKEE